MVSQGHKPNLETETPNDRVSSLAQSQTTTSAKADLNNSYNFDALCRGCSFLVKEHNKAVLCDDCNKWYILHALRYLITFLIESIRPC